MTTPSEDSPRLLLERMYQAEAEYLAAGGPGAASFATLAPFFGPAVVLRQADSLPYGGIWHGHDGLERFFLAMSATWDRFELAEQTFLSDSAIADACLPPTRELYGATPRNHLPLDSDPAQRAWQ
ncbi:hypothetical protein ACSVDM_13855 [Nocardia sp. JW2]|uniref:hypothetical protein n=1 Tax=Nocardia sp. JW2 TaxID=3450738 RepID=UPI003F4297F8